MTRIPPDIADAQLEALTSRYQQRRRPLNVSFRRLLQFGSVRDRATHDLHPYPGRLLIDIPSFFLATTLTRPGDVVLDPFCGSGTVLLEALLAGRIALGADANPLARLITKAKVTPLSRELLGKTVSVITKRFPKKPRGTFPDVINLDYWFYPHVRRDLLILLERINKIDDDSVRTFLLVTFSACIKDVSLADPRLSVPVRLRGDQYPREHWLFARTQSRLKGLRRVNVVDVFVRRATENIARVSSLSRRPTLGRCVDISDDARRLLNVSDGSVDLVLTSPPYLGAQKYIRASSLSLTWLELCRATELRKVEDQNIGREHFLATSYSKPLLTGIPIADAFLTRIRQRNSLRGHIAAVYLTEMREALREQSRVLKKRGHLVLVAGASSVCGESFDTPRYLIAIAAECGLTLRLHLVDAIRSRALMTKRHPTAGRIDSEAILLFSKV